MLYYEAMKRHIKTILAVTVLTVTVAVFWFYIKNHPEVIQQLGETSPWRIALLVGLYGIWWGALAVILQVSLKLYDKKMPAQENILLSAYSSLLNFFGPGQSGPGLRAIYLNRRHKMRVKDYIFATLIYYAFYAIISAGMLFAGSRPWWQTALLVGAAAGGSWGVLAWYAKRSKLTAQSTSPKLKWLGLLFGLTGLQLFTQFIIYSVEISSVMPSVGVGQALAYTGAANFSLFVALTPGAIGIREAFLVFSSSIHHISNTSIVAANIIDRAVYLVFLGLLFILVMSLHAGKKLRWRQTVGSAEAADNH